MTDKVYNVFKYCALIGIPAFGTFYTTIASLWGWPYITEISGTILAFDTMLGAFVGISSAHYQPSADGVLHINPNTKETYAALTTPTDTVLANGTMVLKVQESPDM